MAKRRIDLASLVPPHEATVDGEVVSSQVVLVGLAAAQEVQAGLPLLDGGLKAEHLGEQAHGERRQIGVEATVVEVKLPAAVKAEDRGRRPPVDIHHEEP